MTSYSANPTTVQSREDTQSYTRTMLESNCDRYSLLYYSALESREREGIFHSVLYLMCQWQAVVTFEIQMAACLHTRSNAEAKEITVNTHYPMGFWSYIYLCVAYCISCPASLAWPSLAWSMLGRHLFLAQSTLAFTLFFPSTRFKRQEEK